MTDSAQQSAPATPSAPPETPSWHDRLVSPDEPFGQRNLNPPGVKLFQLLKEDFITHDRHWLSQGFWALAQHRIQNWSKSTPQPFRGFFSLIYPLIHKFVEWTCGISLSYTVPIGRRIHIWHHSGMILGARYIGDDVHIRQNTTFGVARRGDHYLKKPIIEDRVEIGAGAVIVGDITIGHDSMIGANAVVLHSVPPYSVAVGIPAKVIKTLKPPESAAHMTNPTPPAIGIVTIGRNEGDRLRQCLASVAQKNFAVVYVDSNSTDGSVALAQSLGVHVVLLNLATPFTAARARNEGFQHLLSIAPQTQFIMFADGDCEILPNFIPAALEAFSQDPQLAVVCGRRRERFPKASAYNQLCDIEWNTPVGPAKYCGGDALIRVTALQQVHGYNPAIIAGEEPEMCVRLRAHNWKILRIDQDMTLHDAAMTRFSQWWKRSLRSGHAFAEGSALHGAPPERHWVKETKSNYLYGFWIPLLAIVFAYPTAGFSILLFFVYPLLYLKVYRYARKSLRPTDAQLYAVFITLGKFPQALGQLKYLTNRLRHKKAQIIEYKS